MPAFRLILRFSLAIFRLLIFIFILLRRVTSFSSYFIIWGWPKYFHIAFFDCHWCRFRFRHFVFAFDGFLRFSFRFFAITFIIFSWRHFHWPFWHVIYYAAISLPFIISLSFDAISITISFSSRHFLFDYLRCRFRVFHFRLVTPGIFFLSVLPERLSAAIFWLSRCISATLLSQLSHTDMASLSSAGQKAISM